MALHFINVKSCLSQYKTKFTFVNKIKCSTLQDVFYTMHKNRTSTLKPAFVLVKLELNSWYLASLSVVWPIAVNNQIAEPSCDSFQRIYLRNFVDLCTGYNILLFWSALHSLDAPRFPCLLDTFATMWIVQKDTFSSSLFAVFDLFYLKYDTTPFLQTTFII